MIPPLTRLAYYAALNICIKKDSEALSLQMDIEQTYEWIEKREQYLEVIIDMMKEQINGPA